MRHLDLFSGIGGFALAARWMNWTTVQFVEIDSFCQKVLKKHWPNVPIHGDIKTFDGTPFRGTVDIVTGGFPCQPYSSAGKRKGTEDDRHLWPEMLRVIGEVQPRWIVGENVSGLLNWAGGLVLKQIKTDLEDKGYTMLPPCVLPACGKNAPHRRDRLWIVANSTNNNRRGAQGKWNEKGERIFSKPERPSEIGITSNSNSQGLEIIEQQSNGEEFTTSERSYNKWQNWPTVSGVCGRNDGIPDRIHRIKSLGNAIVPQVAFEIFKAIDKTLIP